MVRLAGGRMGGAHTVPPTVCFFSLLCIVYSAKWSYSQAHTPRKHVPKPLQASPLGPRGHEVLEMQAEQVAWEL